MTKNTVLHSVRNPPKDVVHTFLYVYIKLYFKIVTASDSTLVCMIENLNDNFLQLGDIIIKREFLVRVLLIIISVQNAEGEHNYHHSPRSSPLYLLEFFPILSSCEEQWCILQKKSVTSFVSEPYKKRVQV